MVEKVKVTEVTESIEDVLADYAEEKIDPMQLDKKNVEVGEDGELIINKMGLTSIAHNQLNSILGYPHSFARKVEDPKLLNDIKNYCIDKCEKKDVKVLSINKSMITGIVNKEFPLIPTKSILETIADVDKNVRVQYASEDGLNLVTAVNSNPLKDVNDISHVGVSMLFNPRGYNMSAFIYRLVCKNGMISPRALMSRFSNGLAESEVLKSLRQITIDTIEISKNVFMPIFIKTAETEVKDPHAFISNLARYFKLPGGELKEILDNVSALKAPITAYDIINLITAMGSEIIPDNLRKGLKLQTFGGFISNSFIEKRCPACKNMLAA